MGKSLDFIKEQLESEEWNDADKYEFMEEENALEMFRLLGFFKDDATTKTLYYDHKYEKKSFNVVVKYNPDVNFEYYVVDQCVCGVSCDCFPFMNFQKLMYGCIDKISDLEFYDEINSLPDDPCGYSIVCTVGDFVLTEEISDDFPNEDDSEMSTRYVVMLPMKFDVVKEEI